MGEKYILRQSEGDVVTFDPFDQTINYNGVEFSLSFIGNIIQDCKANKIVEMFWSMHHDCPMFKTIGTGNEFTHAPDMTIKRVFNPKSD